MNKKQKTAAVALSAVLACGMFAGCDLVTTNTQKDLAQIVATVNISDSAKFGERFGAYKEAVKTAEISKLEMIMSYISYGSGSTFDSIAELLVNRQIFLQYAKVYFLEKGSWTDPDDSTKTLTFTMDGYRDAVKAAGDSEIESDIAAIGYFLTDDEEARAYYNLCLSLNNELDSIEKQGIDEEDETEYETNVRTTPKGANTERSDYYDPAYAVYTGTGAQASVKGSYETVEKGSPARRKRAYYDFISSMQANNLIGDGEKTDDVTKLEYFRLQLRSNYESLLIQKLGNSFTEEAEAMLKEGYCKDDFDQNVEGQLSQYTADISALESAMDSVSDTSFVLAAPEGNREFGFVINILLPFSTSQTEALNAADQDFGDGKGNKFATRATLLKQIKATDQRGSWFTGETDYSFDAKEVNDKYTGGNADRTFLFFEDNFAEGTKYETLKNYLGKYTYNGTYDAEKRVYNPNPVDIDGFLTEMTGYMNETFGSEAMSLTKTENYYPTGSDWSWYDENGKVDYNKFVYAKGRVNFEGGFNANRMFVAGTNENKALSVINELSFAYNTDAGGLNSYLGYAITANKTDFVNEFEYAAQQAVKEGAGSYYVVPSDYGWHIIYCTFSFVDTPDGQSSPYSFDYGDIHTDGSFSKLYYEALKSNTASSNSSKRQQELLSTYEDSYTIFKERYENLNNNNS